MNPNTPASTTTTQVKPVRRRRRRGMAWWRWAFLIVAAIVTVTSAVCVGVFIGILRELPAPEALEYYDPPQVSHVFDRSGAVAIGQFRNRNVRRQVVTLDEMPVTLRNAFIAIEDRRFFEHYGVDIIGVARALKVDILGGGGKQGASTITMQLARDKDILPIVGRERTYWRKIKEAVFALEIERRYSKKQILEFYLNHIDFGNAAFGVAAAANTFFSKPLSQLTLAECATIAAIPNGPGKYSPVKNPENTRARRNLVLGTMYDCGYITKQEFETASAEPLRIKLGGQSSSSRYPYFLGAVSAELRSNPWEGMQPDDLENGGLRITTTVDPAIQEICERELADKLVQVEKMWVERKESRHSDEMKEWNGTLKPGDTKLMLITKILRPSATDDHTTHVCVELDKYRGEFALPDDLPFYNPSINIKTERWIDVYVQEVDDSTGRIRCKLGTDRPVQGSIVVLDAHNGEVLALVGGSNYYNKEWHGEFNRAITGGRQVGSCFKPFFYAAAFEPDRGFTPADIIVDEPIEYSGNPPYRPINYERAERGEEAFAGPMTLIKALEHSRNVVAIRLFEALGIKRALDVVRRFDFTQNFTLSGGSNRWQVDDRNQGMSLPLGTINVTAYQIAAAYQVFANLGIGIQPQLVSSIVNSKGIALPRPKRNERAVVDPVTAYEVQYLMRQVVISGTGAREIGKYFKSPPAPPICGKTGTTNDSVDAWFVGFTPDLVIAVQVGFDTPRPMGHGMNGGPVAGPIWASVLKNILQTRPKNAWRATFDAPPGISLVNICAATGKRAGEQCPASEHQVYYNVPFRVGQEPQETCDGTGSPRTPMIQPVSSEYGNFICRIHGTAHGVTY